MRAIATDLVKRLRFVPHVDHARVEMLFIVLYCIVCILGTIVSPTNRLNRQDPVWDADSPAPSNLELDGCSKANPPTGWSTLGGHLLNILNNGRVQ